MQPTTNLQEQVELYLSCRKLKDLDFIGKSDPQVKAFIKNQGQGNWMPLGETEKIDNNLNPDFKTTIKVDYQFETKQYLKFEVWDVDSSTDNDLIGSIESSVGEIMGARKQTATLELHGKSGKVTGTLIVRGDKIGNSQTEVVWQWSGVKLMNTDGIFGKSDPFLRFFKEKSGDWLQVHESEFVKNNLNPVWRAFRISDDKLCGGNYSQPIKVECWDNESDGKHRYIGVCEISLEKLKNGENTFQLFNDKKNKNTGTLNLVNFKLRDKITFLDYIKAGEQLNTVVAIDFTGSNGEPTSMSSLHAKLPDGQLNQYQQAIHSVCQIILDYDYDKMVPVYGFGADLKFSTMSSWGTSHCFPCSGIKDKPEVPGLDGIMNIYRHALANLSLSGPTLFGPILKETISAAKKNKKNDLDVYTIFMILTDGTIDDMNEVIELLAEAAELPLSVLIIGVGTAGFGQMETLDGDGGLTTKSGKRVSRDLVQFVPFRNFSTDMAALAKHLLAEIPGQLVEYKTLVGKMPKSY